MRRRRRCGRLAVLAGVVPAFMILASPAGLSAGPAAAQPQPASPILPAAAQAAPLEPNPSECEIQAALLGVTGPDCPPLRMRRPAAPPVAETGPSAPARPAAVPLPAVPGPTPMPAPDLRATFKVEFAFNSSQIRPESREILDRVAAVMNNPAAGRTRFRVVGHTDAVGGDRANLSLSERRAKAVVEYLASRHHVARDRLEALGRGARELLRPDDPKAAVNRRVEIVNLGPKDPQPGDSRPNDSRQDGTETAKPE